MCNNNCFDKRIKRKRNLMIEFGNLSHLSVEDRSCEYLINKILQEINECSANWYYFLNYF